MVSGMNFVHHISNGFRGFGGGYSSSIISGAYGIKEGATYNLMDYTEKTPNDALSYHEWTQINLPLPNWSALSRVEEDMLLEEIVLMSGEFVWEGDWLCGYYPDELEEKVNDLKPLFDHIRNNYASYWKDLNSKKKDLDVDGFGEWSVRKFSIKEAICDSLYEKLSKKGTPSFDLHEKGIFLQPYVMNVNGVEKSYEVSVYSFKKNVKVDCNKFKLQDLSDLAEHQYVKAAYCNDYGLIALYDEGKNEGKNLDMVIQVWSKDGESAEKATIDWLNYLNIVSQSDDSDAKVEENKKQTESNINESNPTGWSIDKCKQLVQRMYDNLSEWAKGLLPEEDLPVVWGKKLPTDRYIVSDAQALIRDKNGKELEGKPKIPQGTEVKIVPNVTTTDGAYIQVEVVGSNPKQLHYTAASNLTKIEILEKPEDWRLLKDIESVKLPFSSILTKQIHVVGDYEIVAKCGNFLCISNGFFDNLGLNEGYLGYWVDCSNMIKIVELPKTIEERKIKIEKSVVDVTNRINTKTKKAEGVGPQACNMCTRTALYYLTGDPVLFPRTGSRIHFTFDKTTDPEIKGNVSGYGKAADIISDLRAGILDDYFEEIEKKSEESFLSYWERLQNYADEGEIIIGAYGTNHVFMIVPGGMIPVVDNSSHTQGGLLKESYKTNPSISDGDKYGFSFNARKILFVNRILECGTTVKDANAPVYANMDYRGYTGETKKINFYKYKKK